MLKVELPHHPVASVAPAATIVKDATPLVDPVTGHLTPMRRYDNDGVAPANLGVVLGGRRPPEENNPSTVVVNLRSVQTTSSSLSQNQIND